MIKFISNLDFHNKHIIHFTNRPFNNVEEMDEFIIKKWNENVKEDDIVYILNNPVCVETGLEVVNKLNGNLIIIDNNRESEILSKNNTKEDIKAQFISYKDIDLEYDGIKLIVKDIPEEHEIEDKNVYIIHGYFCNHFYPDSVKRFLNDTRMLNCSFDVVGYPRTFNELKTIRKELEGECANWIIRNKGREYSKPETIITQNMWKIYNNQ